MADESLAPGHHRTAPHRDIPLPGYLALTADVAEPPPLLVTVMFCGLTGQPNWP